MFDTLLEDFEEDSTGAAELGTKFPAAGIADPDNTTAQVLDGVKDPTPEELASGEAEALEAFTVISVTNVFLSQCAPLTFVISF